MRAAITMPQEEEHAWRRLVNGGVAQASELWGTVNSAASAAAKGTWEGFKPAHKAGALTVPLRYTHCSLRPHLHFSTSRHRR